MPVSGVPPASTNPEPIIESLQEPTVAKGEQEATPTSSAVVFTETAVTAAVPIRESVSEQANNIKREAGRQRHRGGRGGSNGTKERNSSSNGEFRRGGGRGGQYRNNKPRASGEQGQQNTTNARGGASGHKPYNSHHHSQQQQFQPKAEMAV